jgi:hypothetical protein
LVSGEALSDPCGSEKWGQIKIQDDDLTEAKKAHSRNFALTPFFAVHANHLHFSSDGLSAPVSLYPLACVVPSGCCLRNIFENTRDNGLGELKMVSTRLPKNF